MAYTFSGHNAKQYVQYLSASEEDEARYKAWQKSTNIGRHPDDEVGFNTGFPVPEEMWPKQVTLEGRRLYDFNGYGLYFALVSANFKEAVESIEPGVHQFVPVEVLRKDGSPYGEPFWGFSICAKIDAINPALGGVDKVDLGPWSPPESYRWSTKTGAADKLAVYADRITGRAVWKDRRFGGAYHFMSDALYAELKRRKARGFDVDSRHWQEI